jgi:hypothetical protein
MAQRSAKVEKKVRERIRSNKCLIPGCCNCPTRLGLCEKHRRRLDRDLKNDRKFPTGEAKRKHLAKQLANGLVLDDREVLDFKVNDNPFV